MVLKLNAAAATATDAIKVNKIKKSIKNFLYFLPYNGNFCWNLTAKDWKTEKQIKNK